jgi:hypothetical protein
MSGAYPNLTEDIAALTIMRDLKARSFCLPRYTPTKWWECDVFELTGSGYFREYEIKMSVADFKADAEKSHDYGRIPWGTPSDIRKKHDLLAAGDTRGPVEFSFVTPKGLLTPEMIPQWAGLIELVDRGEGHRPTHRWSAVTIVRAPRLHTTKANPKIHPNALGNCYYRFHTALERNANREGLPLTWSDPAPPPNDISQEEPQLT